MLGWAGAGGVKVGEDILVVRVEDWKTRTGQGVRDRTKFLNRRSWRDIDLGLCAGGSSSRKYTCGRRKAGEIVS